jgi:hypothetical protein
MAERVGQTFSVNRLADGPCRQSAFLNSMDMVSQKIRSHGMGRGLPSNDRRKRTLALRGRNQRRDTSEQAGERPLHSVAGNPSTLCAFQSRPLKIFHLPAHAFKNPGRRPPAIHHAPDTEAARIILPAAVTLAPRSRGSLPVREPAPRSPCCEPCRCS